jgi:aconitate hydratase
MKTVIARARFSKSKPNPFEKIAKKLTLGNKTVTYYSLPSLNDPRLNNLPYSIRVLLESAIRNCDEFEVHSKDVENILDWQKKAPKQI